MTADNLPSRFTLRLGHPETDGAPDPLQHPEFYEGVVARRVFAYLVDLGAMAIIWVGLWVVLGILNLVTFGVFSWLMALILALVPAAYHVLQVGGPKGATIGMRLFDLQVRTIDNRPPSHLHALVQVIVFLLSVPPTMGLILLFVFFNRHRRTIHDLFSNTVLLRRRRAPVAAPAY